MFYCVYGLMSEIKNYYIIIINNNVKPSSNIVKISDIKKLCLYVFF